MNLDTLFSLKGKKILVMGALNEHSLGFRIAQAAVAAGASVYLTYQADGLRKRAEKLQEHLGAEGIFPCDVTVSSNLDTAVCRENSTSEARASRA
jgi:enoyl-[acyl-carrier protein] reductase I